MSTGAAKEATRQSSRGGSIAAMGGSALRFLASIAALLLVARLAHGQMPDQIVVFGKTALPVPADKILRFDRKLTFLGMTGTTGAGDASLSGDSGIAVNDQGVYSVPFDQLNDTKVLRFAADGTLVLPSINLQHNPVQLACAQSGETYVLSRIPLLAKGPLYALSPLGSILWSNPQAPSLFNVYPWDIAITPAGELWISGSATGATGWQALIVRVDPGDGGILDQKLLPKPTGFTGPDTQFTSLTAAPDGTLWGLIVGYLTHLAGTDVLQQAPITGGWNGTTAQLRADAQGDLLTISGYSEQGAWGGKLLVYDPATLDLDVEIEAGGHIGGFAIGPTGEEVFAAVAVPPTFTKRLERISLVTGAKSSVSLDPWIPSLVSIPNGDPTGFIRANVVDQQGDADGDGAANRAETLAGSDPFDPTSRPQGPKVYISFAPTTNALILTYIDPDGLLDPQGGLDLSTLSVTIANHGNVFWLLAPFATALDLTPDGKKATLTFGELPLPLDKKWQVEATIADLTGATAWDWQVTPPGDL